MAVPATWDVTGYWFLPEDPAWTPPAELVAFLDSGEAPVCIGFGSMASADPAATARTVTEAIRRAGVRAVLLTGWSGMSDIAASDDVLVIDQVPHSWLFPRCAAVVHHGGAGTTAAALRAGVPAVVVPHGVDQPFWAKRVAELGVGPRPLPRSRLSATSLAAALRTTLADDGMRARAAHLAELISTEDGITTAVDHLSRSLTQTK
ncbi:glycosyltransferase [Amycolatopsis sp. Hca4]|uniref:glycosyltransferase n=1 Tax=Amycolatopsis sp. Hca4 TaxID=2742131 RepID=UPI0015906C4F|nr:glycosyltransferase [Amycolatopsis sp. Hca4]QKV80446.1 glycosyltransferase family 1 protein [Amycolatopsis sp. Hca4]